MNTETDRGEFVSIGDVLACLVRDPAGLLLRRWNWKSALLSSLFRAAIFFFVNLRAGWRAAVAAMCTELLYRGISAGFFGALTQAFRRAQPAWLAATAALILLPFASHALELTVHLARGTPRLLSSIVASVIFTILSTLFHLYAMRRSVLIVGSEGRSIAADFRAMPRVVAGFVAAGPLALWRLVSPNLRLARGELGAGRI